MVNLRQKLLEERRERLARFKQAADKVRLLEEERQRKEREAREEEERVARYREQWIQLEHMFERYAKTNNGIVSYSRIVKEIIRDAIENTGYTIEELMSDRRHQPLVEARQELYWQIYKNTDWSLPRIGKLFRKDHTTILHGVRKVEMRRLGNEKKSGAGVREADRRGKGMHVWRSAEDARRHGRDVLFVSGPPG
jgi:hypothetical protein